MRKERVVLLIDNARLVVAALEQAQTRSDAQLLRSIRHVLNLLASNPFAGDGVRKERIPIQLKHLPNLFRIELAQFWRLLYYVTGDESRILVVVFEICSHKDYDALFGYRKQ